MAALLTSKSEPNERRWNKNENSITDILNTSDKSFNFTIFDVAVLILSVLSILIDLCTDLVLVFHYSSQGYLAWAIGTFVLIFLPSIVVQFFSLRWHIIDKTASVLHWVLHFCMLGIIERYVQIIKVAVTAYKSKNASDVEKVFLDQSDLCMLHLFESFLESAPQLVLQMYVVAVLNEWRFWTGVSVFASLLSLAWALAAYTKCQRRARDNKNSTTWPGLLLQAIWRTGMLTARISTLVLGAYCFGNYFFLLITLHWIAMTIWIIYQKTDFCETYWEERVYNAVVGVIYCFCFFNLQEGQSRWRALAFYLVIVFQNLTCLTIFLMWFGEKTPKLAVSGFISIVGGTILGSTSMLCYYRFFHPSGPIKFFFSPTQTVDPPPYSTVTLRSLKRSRCDNPSEPSQKSPPKSDLKNVLNKSSLSDSVVVVEESLSEDTDPEITILKNWANEKIDESTAAPAPASNKNETAETETDAYKRRPICSSVDLDKLIESESLKTPGTDETSSEVLSAHDYENLCAVNIARETWGLRSWQGYSDIETWLHDDSVIHDRRLDTLTSTTSSDRSVNTLTKDSERTRQDDYMDAIAEHLAQCESETSSDDILNQYGIESLPVVYPLGTLDPIFEEIEETSNNSAEFTDAKIGNGSASTLVATIDEIRRNTPTQNRYPPPESIYDGFSPLSDIKLKQPGNWKKVTFASKLLTFPEDDLERSIAAIADEPKKKIENITENVEKQDTGVKLEEKNSLKDEKDNVNVVKDLMMKDEPSNVEISNKENIPTVASKINYWNKILNSQNEKNGGKKMGPPKSGNVTEKKSVFLLRVLTPPKFPTFQRRKKIQEKICDTNT